MDAKDLVLVDEVLFNENELIISLLTESLHVSISDLCLVAMCDWSALRVTLQDGFTADHNWIVILRVL